MTGHEATIQPDRLTPHLTRATCPDCTWTSRAFSDPVAAKVAAAKHWSKHYTKKH